ncbi:unnamed protein product [Cunninghamella blakesleeana]
MSNVFPLYDPELDTSLIDVFQAFSIQPYKRQLIDKSFKVNLTGTTQNNNDNNTKSNKSNIQISPTKNNPAQQPKNNNNSNNNDLYCKACKKKFNNDATMQNHLKSAKHLAAVKKAFGGGSGGKKSAIKQPDVKEEDQKNEMINPATTEALRKLEALTKLDHITAVKSYMDLSKEFYIQKRPKYTSTSLLSLIELKQNNDIHWMARLYLARLYCIYDKSMEMAYDQYLMILEEKHHIKKPEIINIAQNLDKMDMNLLINKCEHMIEQSKGLSLSFLEEAANAFAQMNTTVMGTSQLSEKISIVLYIFAYKNQNDKQLAHSYCSMISKVFDRLNLTSRSIDFQLYFFDHLTHTSNPSAMKLLFISLLKTVELDDSWRIMEINKRIKLMNDGVIYPDMELLSKISLARCNLDYGKLDNELKYEMECIQLLAQTNDHSLLLETVENELKVDYLKRLQQCLKI